MYTFSIEQRDVGFDAVIYNREERRPSGLVVLSQLGASAILRHETQTNDGLIVPGICTPGWYTANHGAPVLPEQSEPFDMLDVLVSQAPKQILQRLAVASEVQPDPEFNRPPDDAGSFVADSAERVAIRELHQSLVSLTTNRTITFDKNTGQYL